MAEDFARGAEAPPGPSVIEAIDALEAAFDGPLASRSALTAAANVAHAAAAARESLEALELEDYKPPEGKTKDAEKLFEALGHVSVDLAALDAFTAAAGAHAAVGYDNETFVSAALNDLERPIEMKLGRHPEPGASIDPSPCGPLGRL